MVSGHHFARSGVSRDRIAHLRAQASSWQESELICRYCDAMEEAHGEDPQAAKWIEWAREFAGSIDPLRASPLMPDPPEETPEALQELLPDGWSVRGPEYGQYDPRGFRGSGRHP